MSKNTPVKLSAIFSSKFNNQQDLESRGPFKQRKIEDSNESEVEIKSSKR